jgi:hypothetical protein
MKTMSSVVAQSGRSSKAPSVFRTIGAVFAALVTWIVVATILNLPLRASWPHYHEAETAFNFTFAMKFARLTIGAISSIAAGFVTGWIGRDRMRSAMLTGAMLLVLFIPDHYLLWSKFPVWYHLTFLLSLVPLTLLGAALWQASRASEGRQTVD